MTRLTWFLLGAIAAHLFWIAVCVLWWYKMTKDVGQSTREAMREDFQTIREQIRKNMSRMN